MTIGDIRPVGAALVEPVPFQITSQPLDARSSLLVVAGELDLLTIDEFRAALAAASAGGATRLALDLSAVTFIDSLSLAAIVGARRDLGPDGRLAAVIEPDSYVKLIFEIGGIGRVVRLVDTREQALSHLRD